MAKFICVLGSAGLAVAVAAIALATQSANLSATEAVQAKSDKKKKPIAGKADVLRHMPKKFAAFVGFDAAKSTVTLHFEDEKSPSTWKLQPTADVKIHGWWGRAEQLAKGDRVWVWFAVDRKKQPTSILMLADEISEQDMHGWSYQIQVVGSIANSVQAKSGYGQERKLTFAGRELAMLLQQGKKLFLQTAGNQIRLAFTAEQLEAARSKQKEHLRNLWRKQGLPGMVQFLHPLGGEMEIMLDHEAMRWGRYLKEGDKVLLKPAKKEDGGAPVKAVVRKVTPWREFTRVLLVTNSGLDQADLHIGQRIFALVPEPPQAVQKSPLPTDLDRPRSKEERLQWFLACTYCTCKVKGDRCTGMAYTLASCNVNACGMPNNIRKIVGGMIDKGMNDREIMEELLKMRGPTLLQQHLLP